MAIHTSGSRPGFLLKQFLLFYIGFALVPCIVMLYFYFNFDTVRNCIPISQNTLRIVISFFALGSCIAFLGMCAVLRKIVRLSENMKHSLIGKIDKSVMAELIQGEGEVAEIARSFGQILGRLETNVKELEETKRTLHGILSKVARALSSTDNYDSLVKLILETAVDAIGAKAGSVFIFDDSGANSLKTYVGEMVAPEKLNAALSPYVNWILREKRTIVLPTLGRESSASLLLSPILCAPLLSHDKVLGVLCLSGNKFGRNFEEDEINIVSNLSCQIAISFENARLNRDIERTYFETISALALAVEARDPYSRGHSERVGEYASKLGLALGLSTKGQQTLRDASRLHDIGKIGITDSILIKPAALTTDEREIMKKHPTIGEGIVMPLKTFHHLLDPIRHHHEALDGTGYPDGLKGEEIPLLTRIMVVADIYDALTSDRPYRKNLGLEGAKQELDKLVKMNRIDADVVNTLFKLIDERQLDITSARKEYSGVPFKVIT
jgi:hypothetical protein